MLRALKSTSPRDSALEGALYASVTDYTAVYDDSYRDRRGSHTSFASAFCRRSSRPFAGRPVSTHSWT